MAKLLIVSGAAVLAAMVALAAIPDMEPLLPPDPLGINDYVPPLTAAGADAIDLVDPRPDEERTCTLTGQWWASDGCNLRGVIMSCFTPAGLWSRDAHMWKFDGHACRYSVETEDMGPPREAAQ